MSIIAHCKLCRNVPARELSYFENIIHAQVYILGRINRVYPRAAPKYKCKTEENKDFKLWHLIQVRITTYCHLIAIVLRLFSKEPLKQEDRLGFRLVSYNFIFQTRFLSQCFFSFIESTYFQFGHISWFYPKYLKNKHAVNWISKSNLVRAPVHFTGRQASPILLGELELGFRCVIWFVPRLRS